MREIKDLTLELLGFDERIINRLLQEQFEFSVWQGNFTSIYHFEIAHPLRNDDESIFTFSFDGTVPDFFKQFFDVISNIEITSQNEGDIDYIFCVFKQIYNQIVNKSTYLLYGQKLIADDSTLDKFTDSIIHWLKLPKYFSDDLDEQYEFYLDYLSVYLRDDLSRTDINYDYLVKKFYKDVDAKKIFEFIVTENIKSKLFKEI